MRYHQLLEECPPLSLNGPAKLPTNPLLFLLLIWSWDSIYLSSPNEKVGGIPTCTFLAFGTSLLVHDSWLHIPITNASYPPGWVNPISMIRSLIVSTSFCGLWLDACSFIPWCTCSSETSWFWMMILYVFVSLACFGCLLPFPDLCFVQVLLSTCLAQIRSKQTRSINIVLPWHTFKNEILHDHACVVFSVAWQVLRTF